MDQFVHNKPTRSLAFFESEPHVCSYLPLEMSRDSVLLVFGLTLFMCAGSGLLALRKLRSADPADVF